MAGGYSKIDGEDGKQFSSEYQPKNRGRKPKTFTMFNAKMKEEGFEPLSKEQLIEAYQIIFSLDELAIKEIANDKEQPLYLRLIIKEMTDDTTRSKALADFRDYVFGRAMQSITSKVEISEQPLFPD